MKFVVMVETSENRGDHAADVFQIYESPPGETVSQLVGRLLANCSASDSIRIKREVSFEEARR